MPTRDEIYTAIRNADKAGDSAGVRKLGEYLQTLPAETAPEAAPVDHSARMAQIQQELRQLEDEKPGTLDNLWGMAKGVAKSTADTALNLGTQALATPIAGVAGLATAPLGFIPGMEGVGARNVERVQNALTYQPHSDVGKETQALIAKPFEKLTEAADWAATNTPLVNKSPLLQTALNTAIQALPAVLMRKGGPLSKVRVGGASAETAGAAAASAEAPNVTAAKTYVANTLGVDWNSLAQSVRDKLSTIAQDATALDKLDPAAIAREAKFQSLPVPVPATRGTLARDPVAMRNEGNASATTAGQPIRDIHLAANQALLDNLDVLRGKVAGTGKTASTATTAEQVGANVQGAARGKLELQRAKVKALYEKADEAGETLQPINDGGMLGIMEAVGDTVDQPHFSYVNSWLKGNTKKIDTGQITIRDMEKLRKQAVAKAMNGGEDGHYAKQLITAIDAATDGVGGKLYQEARAARKAQAMEFQEQGAVADLVDNSSRTDRVTALENTTKSILNGSLEDVRKIKGALLTGGDETTRAAGKSAWRDVRTQVIDDIKRESTRSASPNIDGSPNLLPSQLKTVIDRYGQAKLDEIFGPGTTKQIYKILDVARDAKTQPPTGAVGSSTFANIMAFLEKGVTKIPGGSTAASLVRGAATVKNIGAASREASRAATTPLSEALSQAKSKATRKQLSSAAGELVPLSQIGAAQTR